MSDDHIDVPPKNERSVINRAGDQHKTHCKDWVSGKVPFPCNAHHILPVTCFNRIKCNPQAKAAYVRRCIWVSKWNINGGTRHKQPEENNMIRLPLFSAYNNAYPKPGKTEFRKAEGKYPVNECMHNSRYSEHYIYNKEVRTWLNDNVWSKLQEDKEKHKLKGKDILKELQGAEGHFRGELVKRGKREPGTKKGWMDRPDKWWMPFTMAHDDETQLED